jgi:hypothetical protein
VPWPKPWPRPRRQAPGPQLATTDVSQTEPVALAGAAYEKNGT